MANDIFEKENLSTIAVWVYMLISPVLVKYGIDIDQALFVSAFVGVVGIILAIYSSLNPNKFGFLGNDTEPTEDIQTEPEFEDDDCA